MNRKRKRARALRTLQRLAIAPTLMTLANLLCGFAAIFYASREPPELELLDNYRPLTIAAGLIFLAMVFDGLDGRVARLTRSTTDFGAQLDSMADMVSFGVAPAIMVIQLIDVGTPFFGTAELDTYFGRATLLIGGAYVACAGLRLARFNIETTDADLDAHMWFRGLPSPGAAGTVASLVLLHQYLIDRDAETLLTDVTAVVMVGITFVAALAMISTLAYVHVLNRYLRGRGTFEYVALLAVGIILLLTIPRWSLAAGFILYALSGPVTHLRYRRRLADTEPLETLEP